MVKERADYFDKRIKLIEEYLGIEYVHPKRAPAHYAKKPVAGAGKRRWSLFAT
jgi:hypothetical protein